MYICSHMLCVPILPVYLLSVSVYSCIIFIWNMKQTDVVFVCSNTVVMWSLFTEVIVSFCVKITQGKFM